MDGLQGSLQIQALVFIRGVMTLWFGSQDRIFLTEVRTTCQFNLCPWGWKSNCSWETNKQKQVSSSANGSSSALGRCWQGCLGKQLQTWCLAVLELGSVTAVCHWTFSTWGLLEMFLCSYFEGPGCTFYCFQTLVHVTRLKLPTRVVSACQPPGFIGEWIFTLQRHWLNCMGCIQGNSSRIYSPQPLSLL